VALTLCLDEDSSAHSLIDALRARGIDVLTAAEAGMIERPDEDQLTLAASQHRVLVSFNRRDFYRLHTEWLSEGRSPAGIVLLFQRRLPVAVHLRPLLRVAAENNSGTMVDRVEFLSEQ
jgi:hypothetical protein